VDEELRNPEWRHEAEELVVLVEVILRLDVVLATVRWAGEVDLSGECDIRVVEGYKPQAEKLCDVEVEDHVGGVVGCYAHSSVAVINQRRHP
jgi:hypothetical protein